MKISLSVVIRELHCHVLEMKNMCKILIGNSQGKEITVKPGIHNYNFYNQEVVLAVNIVFN
jgi:hypothetical protein